MLTGSACLFLASPNLTDGPFRACRNCLHVRGLCGECGMGQMAWAKDGRLAAVGDMAGSVRIFKVADDVAVPKDKEAAGDQMDRVLQRLQDGHLVGTSEPAFSGASGAPPSPSAAGGPVLEAKADEEE